MPTHRFQIGSLVSLTTDAPSVTKAGRYVIEAQMPPVGTSLQYRIKSEGEDFRRVVVEHQLRSLEAPDVRPADPLPQSLHGEQD